MNRWTGTGRLTKDPKLLETDTGTAICTLRIAVKRAARQGQDYRQAGRCRPAYEPAMMLALLL